MRVCCLSDWANHETFAVTRQQKAKQKDQTKSKQKDQKQKQKEEEEDVGEAEPEPREVAIPFQFLSYFDADGHLITEPVQHSGN